jgi:hypothetical protein
VSAAIEWGSTADERAASYPCEEFVPDAELAVYRAIDIAAPVPVVFRWLCQFRVAPCSYDLLDNLGRRSPRELTPGADERETGQRIMTIFHLRPSSPTVTSRSCATGSVRNFSAMSPALMRSRRPGTAHAWC